MELFNLLEVAIPVFGETYSIELDFIGKFIRILVGAVGSVGVGIILFSLALKLITLPFDVYQRIAMRKQNLKMKENQERMEKLQKQYANDKDMYNQKVMEMYKESGMSMFSSCLPMILSMIIFFVAIGSFNSFSSYSNLENYNVMVQAYNEQLLPYAPEITDKTLTYELNLDEEGKPTGTVVYTVKDDESTDKLFYYKALYSTKDGEITHNETTNEYGFNYDFAAASKYVQKASKDYYIDVDKVTNDANRKAKIDELVNTIKADRKAELDKLTADLAAATTDEAKADIQKQIDKIDEEALASAVVEYFVEPAQVAVVDSYNAQVKQDTKFFWIKNIWVTDAAYKHPVLSYKDFSTSIVERSSCSCSADSKVKGIPAYTEEGYKLVTEKLTTQKKQPNGYFILIALSIGTILLQQFVSMRSQKEQQKYSSVDGQSGGQQKMMMVVMTGMFAIFSFMYSSAFSIYLIVSNIFSLGSTLIINKIVDKIESDKAAKAEQEKHNKRFPGRVAKSEAEGKKSAKARKENKENKSAKTEKGDKSDKKKKK